MTAIDLLFIEIVHPEIPSKLSERSVNYEEGNAEEFMNFQIYWIFGSNQPQVFCSSRPIYFILNRRWIIQRSSSPGEVRELLILQNFVINNLNISKQEEASRSRFMTITTSNITSAVALCTIAKQEWSSALLTRAAINHRIRIAHCFNHGCCCLVYIFQYFIVFSTPACYVVEVRNNWQICVTNDLVNKFKFQFQCFRNHRSRRLEDKTEGFLGDWMGLVEVFTCCSKQRNSKKTCNLQGWAGGQDPIFLSK